MVNHVIFWSKISTHFTLLLKRLDFETPSLKFCQQLSLVNLQACAVVIPTVSDFDVILHVSKSLKYVLGRVVLRYFKLNLIKLFKIILMCIDN